MTEAERESSKEAVLSATLRSTDAIPFDDDQLLVERFVSGERSAFEVLYSRYYEKVFALARGIVLDSEEAQDVVQEIFTLAYRNLHKFDRRSKFGTWLFRIAVNRSIQQTRKMKRAPKLTELNESLVAPEDERSTQSDPQIYQALSVLQPADRALLTMFYWEELSLQEIADSLGCNVNAAKTRLYRARERFREAYEKDSL